MFVLWRAALPAPNCRPSWTDNFFLAVVIKLHRTLFKSPGRKLVEDWFFFSSWGPQKQQSEPAGWVGWVRIMIHQSNVVKEACAAPPQWQKAFAEKCPVTSGAKGVSTASPLLLLPHGRRPEVRWRLSQPRQLGADCVPSVATHLFTRPGAI